MILRALAGLRIVAGARSWQDLRLLAHRWLRWNRFAFHWQRRTGLPAPPWPRAALPASARVVAEWPAQISEISRPLAYGGTPPDTFLNMPATTQGRTLRLTEVPDVVVIPQHMAYSLETQGLLPQSFELDFTPTASATRSGLHQSPPSWRKGIAISDAPVFVAMPRFNEFGHRLLEGIPCLMMLGAAPPDIDIVTSMQMTPEVRAMVGALGIDPTRFRHTMHPVLCRTAYLPDPPIRLAHDVHPLAMEAFECIGHLGHGAVSDPPRRIFLSRRGIPRRRLADEAAVEALFEQHGFTIVQPERHPIEVQIGLMQGASAIAGAAGSAMHLAVFAPPEARTLILCPPNQFWPIDALLQRLPGHLAYVFGTERPRSNAGAPTWAVDTEVVHNAINRHFPA